VFLLEQGSGHDRRGRGDDDQHDDLLDGVFALEQHESNLARSARG
jgi:hypothetical protein